jgi:ATP-dependent helicase/nuclease subunit B
MDSFDLAAALAAGTTIVTPNKRLARALVARHDNSMMRAGCRAWPAARALPWHAWLQTLWQEVCDAEAMAPLPHLLAPIESRYLWERVIAGEGIAHASLLDPSAAAALAEEAWELVHAWGAGGESWRAWRGSGEAPEDSDSAAFARWAEAYRRELDRHVLIDMACLPDALAQAAHRVPGWRDGNAVWVGFLELSPQQSRLRERVSGAGMAITVVPAASGPVNVKRTTAPTPREEVRMALAWARALADEAPERTIGIAIEDLAARRDEVRALADEVLCPILQLPGHAGAARPYDLSLGASLAEAPMVAAALSLLALARDRIGSPAAASLLRSPYLPGPWTERAGCERKWLEESRAELAWDDVLATLAETVPALAARWRAVAVRTVRSGTASPRGWIGRWRAFLEQCGWPGDIAPGGADFECRNAWERMLEEFSRIGHVDERMPAERAMRTLRDVAARTIFQPEAPPVAITIMGILEAAALPLDALWVAGLSAQRWPPPPRPNPLLPLRWQRERSVPRSNAARELGYTQYLTACLAGGAPQVVMSAPISIDDYPGTPSALIDPSAPALASPPPGPDSARTIAAARAIEAVADARAPALAPGALKGGAGVIAAQADCPFRATAVYRLDAQPWPRAAEGLDPMERGQLVHASLAEFWRDVRTQAALCALDPETLAQRVEAAVAVARGAVPAFRWQMLPPVVAAAEARRIAQICIAWLDEIDRERPSFAVWAVERPAELTLCGLTLRMRLDRIDLLSEGGAVIIDYKTGHVDSPKSWFAARPRSPQLGLYALALQADGTTPALRAVAYARVKAGAIAALGIAADDTVWPALTDAGKLGDPSGWVGVLQRWEHQMAHIAGEVREGLATVTPRDGGVPCRFCGLQPLCRIGAAGLAAVGDAEGGPDDNA